MPQPSNESPAWTWKLIKWIVGVPVALLLIIVMGASIRYVSNKSRLDRLQSAQSTDGRSGVRVSVEFENVVPDAVRKIVGDERSQPFDQIKAIDFLEATDDDLLKWRGSYDTESISLISFDRNGGITDRGLALLGELQLLTRLEISGGQFTSKGLTALANCPKLTHLEIDHTELSADWHSTIKLFPHLTELIVNKVDEITAQEIMSIASIPRLQTVCLNGSSGHTTDQIYENPIGANWCIGAEHLPPQLLEPLAIATRIETLMLECDSMEADTFRPLTKLASLRLLQISADKVIRDNLKELGGCRTLESLILVDGNDEIDHGFDELTAVKSLTQLALYCLHLTANDVQQISQLNQLRSLRIEPELPLQLDLAPLKSLTNLEELDVKQIQGFDPALSIIQSMPRLQWLRFKTHVQFPHPLQVLVDQSLLPADLMADARVALGEVELHRKMHPKAAADACDPIVLSMGTRKLLPKDRPPPVGIGF